MTLNLDQILQETEEFSKIRDRAGQSNYYGDVDEAANTLLLYAANNFDSVGIIRELVFEIKKYKTALESSIVSSAETVKLLQERVNDLEEALAQI